MKWRIILLFWLVGAAIGAASLFGFTQGIELYLWLAAALLVPVAVARSASEKLYLHGLIIGLGMGILKSFVQFFAFNVYIASNPDISAQLSSVPSQIPLHMFLLIAGTIAGGVYGLVLGGLCAAAKNFFQP